ncbi:hypothetical protein AB1Y20_014131 [Prymnesium parvum]|uniref:acetyl-CoA C-acyltransferase n=1 Tax=Prymnesium parvum TaxID=97485 RepID=A0AB34IFC3_PRYPA|mmetsp:Transcript_49948/g.124198  ORF Transcript_49948/g.124198 Transcript_49948/m.124198 type:complete len:392 (+) Transcript_49948:11-1186(+)
MTMGKEPEDVVVVSALRTPICKARRGALRNVTPDDLLCAVLRSTLSSTGLSPALLGDVAVGNVQQAGSYAGPARMAALRAGIPASVPLHAINRQCASGLQAVASVAAAIAAGHISIGIAAGVESMSCGGGASPAEMPPCNLNEILAHPLAAECLVPMGMTAENVAERYGVTRLEQDRMAASSHAKALAAQAGGRFSDEIVPITLEDGAQVTADDGPRKDSTLERLAALPAVFKEGGTVTAGSSSQVSDGAAAVLLMSRRTAEALGLRPLGTLRSYRVVGVQPEEMGIGPAAAVPAALDAAGVDMQSVDIFELNEAFAAQAVYCVKKLGIPEEKLNPNGGAIALGHPLGCTGARQVATLLHELRRSKKRFGVVTMCIGTGMGAAALFEADYE